VRLLKPAKVVYVRYTGNPGINVIRATVHLKPEKTPERAIVITHGYKLGDQRIEHDVSMTQPGDYTVQVDGDPENLFIRMAVPSESTED
jgi:hypothetical protein